MLPDNATSDRESNSPSAPSPAAPTPPAAGAPKGNENATKSGVSAWLSTGKLPSCYVALRDKLEQFAGELHLDVQRVKGREPTLAEECLISTAVRHAGRMVLLERWLARERETLAVGEKLAILKEIGAAATSRDKVLEKLGLDVEPGDTSAWAILDALDARDSKPALPSAASDLRAPSGSYARPMPAAAKPVDATAEKSGSRAGNHVDLPVLPFEAQL